MATRRFITLGRLKSMTETAKRSMLFGRMLVEWECEQCKWLEFLDIDEGTDYPQLEELIKDQHNTIKPQCDFQPNRIWLNFRPAEV
jgi:hypothetical protein